LNISTIAETGIQFDGRVEEAWNDYCPIICTPMDPGGLKAGLDTSSVWNKFISNIQETIVIE